MATVSHNLSTHQTQGRKQMNIFALDLGKFNTTCCSFNVKTRKTQFL
jgi:hypothetical protein